MPEVHQTPSDETFRQARICCGRPTKLGVVGCGSHAIQGHLLHLESLEAASLSVLFDPSKQSLERSLDRFGLCKTSDSAKVGADSSTPAIALSEEALLASAVDAVMVMSPDEFHAGSLQRAVRAGKHVFVEKPLAVNATQLGEVIKSLTEASKRGLVVSSCHPRRFDPPFMWLKEKLPELIAEYGKTRHFEFDFSYHRPGTFWKHERGLLMDHANHEIDLVNWYFGHSAFEAWKLIDSPKEYHAVGVRDDHIRFSFNGTRKLESKVYEESVLIRFERALLSLNATHGQVRIFNHETQKSQSLKIEGTNYVKRSEAVNENFVKAAQGTMPCYLTHKDLLINTAFGVFLTQDGHWRYDGGLEISERLPSNNQVEDLRNGQHSF